MQAIQHQAWLEDSAWVDGPLSFPMLGPLYLPRLLFFLKLLFFPFAELSLACCFTHVSNSLSRIPWRWLYASSEYNAVPTLAPYNFC
jgi:hypothetical protein